METLDDESASSFGKWRVVATSASGEELALESLAQRAKELARGPAVPRSLGHYQLTDLLGTGGMGQVYKAEHRLMKRTVAVKLLAADLFRSETARARFRREVELAGRVASPHVVAALDAGEVEGFTFLVMEYVEGRNLAEVVKKDGPRPLRQALEYLRQAARGLADAHAAGIVHRDVKPSNLIVNEHGVVKLLDLGLAQATLESSAESPDLTGRQAVMGTAAYIAPEQAADIRRADARSDIYSLGCTLFFLLTGRPPFEGETVMEVLFAHREQPMPSLRQARPDCPPALETLFRKMTARRPEDRPAAMTAVVAEVDRLLGAPVPLRRRFGFVAVAAGLLLTAAALLPGALWPPPQAEPTLLAQKPDSVPPAPTQPTAASLTDPTPAAPAKKPAGPEMILIKPGEFWMGSSADDPDADGSEKPRHRVQITQAFWLGKFEVTQEEFQELMGTNPSAFSSEGRKKGNLPPMDTKRLPVESVSWLAAIQFCNRLSDKCGLKPFYGIDGQTVKILGGAGYRLPTEAEWEFACRAGSETRWSFGDDVRKLDDYAWNANNSGRMPHPVGQKKPNPWGLFDMHGNVPEWCWDRYDAGYYKTSVVCDPPGPGKGEQRVYRGGSWNHQPAQTRSANRDLLGLSYGPLAGIGLRVCATPSRDRSPSVRAFIR